MLSANHANSLMFAAVSSAEIESLRYRVTYLEKENEILKYNSDIDGK